MFRQTGYKFKRPHVDTERRTFGNIMMQKIELRKIKHKEMSQNYSEYRVLF
jgi:hypothetical protein